MAKANESMTSWLLELLASYAGPLNPELGKILNDGVSQLGSLYILPGLHKSQGKEAPREFLEPLPFKSRLEYLINEVDISKLIGLATPVESLVQGLLFAQRLKELLSPVGKFVIFVTWGFQENCVVSFYKLRRKEIWPSPGETVSPALAMLEIKT